MSWKIHIRKDGQAFQHTAHNLHSAIAVACVLLRDGINVEWIEGPEGLEVTGDALRPLCDGQRRS